MYAIFMLCILSCFREKLDQKSCSTYIQTGIWETNKQKNTAQAGKTQNLTTFCQMKDLSLLLSAAPLTEKWIASTDRMTRPSYAWSWRSRVLSKFPSAGWEWRRKWRRWRDETEKLQSSLPSKMKYNGSPFKKSLLCESIRQGKFFRAAWREACFIYTIGGD